VIRPRGIDWFNPWDRAIALGLLAGFGVGAWLAPRLPLDWVPVAVAVIAAAALGWVVGPRKPGRRAEGEGRLHPGALAATVGSFLGLLLVILIRPGADAGTWLAVAVIAVFGAATTWFAAVRFNERRR